MFSAKTKGIKSYQNIERLPYPFYIQKVKCISIFLFYHIFLCYGFVETIFNIDLCTLVTKYTIILNFNFLYTIYPQWRIMPHNATSLHFNDICLFHCIVRKYFTELKYNLLTLQMCKK